MKYYILFSLLISLNVFASSDHVEKTNWSQDAHRDLIISAFSNERTDCVLKIKEGSEWVDSVVNQVPSRSYMHAMRSGKSQSIHDAKKLMTGFIQSNYLKAIELKAISTVLVTSTSNDPFAQYTHDGLLITDINSYLSHCYYRGVALHPAMDSTSPAHMGFEIWSIADLAGIFLHGDFPGSVEDEQALLRQPEVMNQTIGLMRMIDKIYIEFNMKDFRYE